MSLQTPPPGAAADAALSPRQQLVAQLVRARERPCFQPEVRTASEQLAARALGLLFPHFAERPDCSPRGVEREMAEVQRLLRHLQGLLAPHVQAAGTGSASGLDPELPERFMDALGRLYKLQQEDAEALFQGDPAARSLDEVILTYPGFYAVAIYRFAHALHGLGLPLVPRLLTEMAHRRTGVDIHPGARIGRRFVIDHGTGVVIGETCVIGSEVKVYQGVTLGALTVEKALADQKRHPTLEDRVVVYANATILGGSTVIGHDSVIGGNAWITASVPPFSLVSRKSEVRVRAPDGDTVDLEFHI
jgi:serine O-acetyltransferase